jgi:hypothetical protein
LRMSYFAKGEAVSWTPSISSILTGGNPLLDGTSSASPTIKPR